MRKHETAKDYKTLTDQAVYREMCDNLNKLVKYLNEQAEHETLLRSKAIKISPPSNIVINIAMPASIPYKTETLINEIPNKLFFILQSPCYLTLL